MLSEGETYTFNPENVEVLILVLMEYALWEVYKATDITILELGLNPCFNGICSLRYQEKQLYLQKHLVLILVLMEYALWVARSPRGQSRTV